MNLTNPFLDADGDKLREECGVFGVIGAKDAAAYQEHANCLATA